ncbi:MAG: nitroreductase family protein [Clostridiales bacterium]|nr:nitroreductase family protein [Clostridiales bacterium]
MNSIFHRVSIRNYQNKEVEGEKIKMLLRAAMAAPSAKNQQPWCFYVTKEKDLLEKLSGSSPYSSFIKNAAVAIAACYYEETYAPEYAQIDLSAAVENILLEADNQGLGAVWLGIAPHKERMDYVKETLHLPEGTLCFALISIGYPAEEKKQQDRYDENRIHFIGEKLF